MLCVLEGNDWAKKGLELCNLLRLKKIHLDDGPSLIISAKEPHNQFEALIEAVPSVEAPLKATSMHDQPSLL